jgi:alkaline phosphatase
MSATTTTLAIALLLSSVSAAAAQTSIRIMPPDRGTFAVGQRFDIRVEATSATAAPPRGLVVTIDGRDVSARNVLDAGTGGERGAGGTGATAASLPAHHRAAPAPPNTTNFLLREFSFDEPGVRVIAARTADGAEAQVAVTVDGWQAPRAGARPARNIILLLGDGMGAAHRTAARIISRGVRDGKARSLLAMDTMPITGQVMTMALNAVITDSAPGMSSYVTGQKGNNNQVGVFPDNTADAFDNPRVEYLGALLRRTRGAGFNVGLVTTADVTDATPAGNAIHTANRNAGPGIAAQFYDERDRHAVSVLMGGGARHFTPAAATAGTTAATATPLRDRFASAGYREITSRRQVLELLGEDGDGAGRDVPARLLGLFHPQHLNVAFDKVGAERYSDELSKPEAEALRDQPMLDEMTRLALASLSRHSPAGFYLMVEGASIDKRAHAVDSERTIWDTIEFDNAVRVALDFAARTNGDDDPANDTLVIVTADHECGGLAIIGVGNERYAPTTLGRGVRDYAAVFRFEPEQALSFVPNYEPDEHGYPRDPDPSRKLLLGWAAAPDRHENWLSNRLMLNPAVLEKRSDGTAVAVADPRRDSEVPASDNRAVGGQPIPGFLVPGTIENGAAGCPAPDGCPADTASEPHTMAGHTATDVPLSAIGPGAWQFTGTYENSDVFLKLLRSAAGSYEVTLDR